ncbi:helix-turn-helix transcriptional regulator [Runella slithyformis]|uniref:Helix-turn-helix domain protein n=1 Tax=Runella slithyformis (strain ATCC 29530 / DSM 19594 / LMG 11500 / NCIMB 11436 / LSU 4) TaxID=761193 RepID=A0A7U4E7T6_RUNSL|nr:helix-turn-helix transcriptional regulator [Runella slithyformis]AEI50724.1 helix-turn-helix domain protein [Runella slithyformis DSM 19594]
MEKKELLHKIGQRVVRLRMVKNWSQADLARASLKDRQSIERLENGKVNPSVYYLQEVAKALEVPLLKIFEWDE